MPQASDELRAEWPEGDSEALAHLDPNFLVTKGGIILRRRASYCPNRRDFSALSYLIQEWDYDYSDEAPAP